MAGHGNARDVGEEIARLLEEIRALASPKVWTKVDELLHVVLDLYGRGLERVVSLADAEEVSAAQLRKKLLADSLVSSLLILHGLHPVDAQTRVHEALEKVRPYLGSHAGGVKLLGMDEQGVVRLRLEGNCNGCPSSTMTVKLAIERAIHDAAPEVERVEVEGVVDQASVDVPPALVQLGVPRNGTAGTWTALEGVGRLSAGETKVVEVEGLRVMVCSLGHSLYAYRDACAACGSALERAKLEDSLLTCPNCSQGYDIRLAGRAVDGPSLHLEPLPLLADAAGTRIALPGTTA